MRRDNVFVTEVEDRTRYEDSGLAPGTTYDYEIRSVRNGVTQSTTCSGTTPGRALTCSVAVVGEDITVSFNGGDFSRVSIQRDGTWQATLSNGETTFLQTAEPGTYVYTATGVVDGFSNSADCGTAEVAARTVVCSVANVEDQVTVSFNGADFSRATVHRDGAWQATLTDGEVDFVQTVDAGTYSYSVTGILNGLSETADCGRVTVTPPVLTCTVTVEGDDILVTWNDVGAASYQARRNDSWAATLDQGTITWTDVGAAAAGNSYEVRYRLDGVLNTISCA